MKLSGFIQLLGALPLAIASNCTASGHSSREINAYQDMNRNRTLSVGYVLFPGFQPLDVYGPLEMLISLSFYYKIAVSTISFEKGPVSSLPPPHSMMEGMPPKDYGFMSAASTMATHTFSDAPALDVIIVPGGMGNIALIAANNTEIEDFIADRFDKADHVLSVCTGAVTLARSGVLDGRKATTNKAAWSRVTKQGPNVTWVPSARWVVDDVAPAGKVWSSSGVSSGMDMMYAFLLYIYGAENVDNMLNGLEYAPHTDPTWDPYSYLNRVPGAVTTMSEEEMTDRVRPVGRLEPSSGMDMSEDNMDMESDDMSNSDDNSGSGHGDHSGHGGH